MGFLDSVQLPDGTTGVSQTPTISQPKGSFLSSVVMPANPQEAVKIQGMQQNATALQDQSQQASSPVSIAKQSIISPFVDVAKKMYGAAKDAFTQAPQQSFDTKPLDVGANSLSSAISDAGNKVQIAASTALDHHTSLLQKGVNVGEAGMGVINALFSPVTSTLSAVSAMPVVGYVADGVNAFFGALGAGGSEVASKAVDGLPVSQQTKDTIRPLASEIGGLTAQIVAGKVGGDVYAKLAEKTKAVTDTIAQDPVIQNPHSIGETPTQSVGQVKGGFLDTVQKPEAPIAEAVKPVEAPTSPLHTEALKYGSADEFVNNTPVHATTEKGATGMTTERFQPQGNYNEHEIRGMYMSSEGNVAGRYGNSLVTAIPKDGARILEGKPAIDFLNKFPQKGSGEAITQALKDAGYDAIKTSPTSEIWVNPDKANLVRIPSTLTDIYNQAHGQSEVLGKTPSKVAKSIEAKAVEANLTKSFDGVAGYDPITIKDQALRAADVMKNMDTAKQMVKGEIPMANGLRAEALIKAMEDHAQATGDVHTLRDIANSPLTSETSAHAQAMRLLAERNPDSVVTKLQKIKQERAKIAEKKGGNVKKEVADMKHEIKKTPKREDWDNFIKNLTCSI